MDNVRYIWTLVQIITQFVIGITFLLATTYDPSLNGEPLTCFHSTWRTVGKFLKIWTRLFWIGQDKAIEVAIYILWFNFILGLNFIFFCFWVWKCMIMIYKQKKIKIKPRIKLNHNTHTHTHTQKISECDRNKSLDKQHFSVLFTYCLAWVSGVSGEKGKMEAKKGEISSPLAP